MVSLQQQQYALRNVITVKKKQIIKCVLVVTFVFAEFDCGGMGLEELVLMTLYSVALPQRIS